MMFRSKKLLVACRELPCQHCGRSDGTVCAAHANWLQYGKGRSIKAHDCYVAALCSTCHAELDQGSKMDRAERLEMWRRAFERTIYELFQRGLITVA